MQRRRQTRNELYYFVNTVTNRKIAGPFIPWFWAFFAAPLYFLYWQAWRHALISIILYITTFGFAGLAYAMFARRTLENTYLRKRWRIVNLNENGKNWVNRNSPVMYWTMLLSLCYLILRSGWERVGTRIFEDFLIPNQYVAPKAIQISNKLELAVLSLVHNINPYLENPDWYRYLNYIPTVISGTAFCLVAVPIFILLDERVLRRLLYRP